FASRRHLRAPPRGREPLARGQRGSPSGAHRQTGSLLDSAHRDHGSLWIAGGRLWLQVLRAATDCGRSEELTRLSATPFHVRATPCLVEASPSCITAPVPVNVETPMGNPVGVFGAPP